MTNEVVELGQVSTFTAVTSDEVGIVEYRWDFGDGEQTEWLPDQVEVEHLYAEPGHYTVNLLVRDDATPFEGRAFTHTVYRALTPKPPVSSSTIVYDAVRNRVYNVNPDNATVTVVDAAALTKVGEIPVYLGPEALAIAPDGKLWVLHKEDYAVAIIDLDTLQSDGLVIREADRIDLWAQSARMIARLRGASVLLLDDVQFLAGRRGAQEELLRSWDALTARGGQVVLASDRPPAEIDGIDQRLLSRFSGGLMADLSVPDYETRVAIVRHKAEERGHLLSAGVAEALAKHAFGNVRELQNILKRAIAGTSVTSKSSAKPSTSSRPISVLRPADRKSKLNEPTKPVVSSTVNALVSAIADSCSWASCVVRIISTYSRYWAVSLAIGISRTLMFSLRMR